MGGQTFELNTQKLENIDEFPSANLRRKTISPSNKFSSNFKTDTKLNSVNWGELIKKDQNRV